MSRAVGSQLKARTTGADLLPVGLRLVLGPLRWRRRLLQVSVPTLLREIEQATREGPGLTLPVPLIAHLVHRRAVLSIRWRRRRCLLSSLLFADLLPRAGFAVTVHVGCAADRTGRPPVHCWVSSPENEAVNRLMSDQGMTELYRRTLRPWNDAQPMPGCAAPMEPAT